MNVKLKPCPFCGGKAIIDGCDETLWIVICKECNASIGYKETVQEAIDAWNNRVQPTFTPEELEEIFHRLIGHYPEMSDAGCSAFEKITHWRNRQSIVDKCNAALKGGRVE